MKILTYTLVFLFGIGAGAATAAAKLTAADVSARVEREGAQTVLQTIYADNDQWAHLLASIATGRREWLLIAVALHPASDAGSSEQLTLAVGEALEHRPENVLTVAISTYPLDVVCDVPETDDPRFDSLSRALATLNRRQAMLRTVTAPAVRMPRDKCIEQLDAAKAEIAKYYGDQTKYEASQKGNLATPK
jgi:hypothetical protein